MRASCEGDHPVSAFASGRDTGVKQPITGCITGGQLQRMLRKHVGWFRGCHGDTGSPVGLREGFPEQYVEAELAG